MKTRLISILLMCVFAIPFAAQAADIGVSAPSYQVDTTHSMNVDKSDAVAAVAVNQESQSNTANASLFEQGDETIIISTDCKSYHSNAVASSIGVLGGDSIGIRQLS